MSFTFRAGYASVGCRKKKAKETEAGRRRGYSKRDPRFREIERSDEPRKAYRKRVMSQKTLKGRRLAVGGPLPHIESIPSRLAVISLLLATRTFGFRSLFPPAPSLLAISISLFSQASVAEYRRRMNERTSLLLGSLQDDDLEVTFHRSRCEEKCTPILLGCLRRRAISRLSRCVAEAYCSALPLYLIASNTISLSSFHTSEAYCSAS